MTTESASTTASDSSATWGRVLLAAATLYLFAVLLGAFVETNHLEQDSAHYVEVVERALAGEGFTSMSDRRGPAPWRPFPQAFEASNRWPWVLYAVALVTGGDPRTSGSLLSVASFLVTIWLLAWTLVRGLGVPWWCGALFATGCLVHRRMLGFMVWPQSDALSLLLNVGVLAALVRGRNALAVAVAAAACVVRLQNCALVFPLAWGLGVRWPRLRPWGLAVASVAGLVVAGPPVLDGLRTFVDPTESVSLWRTLRFAALPLLVGIVVAWRDARLAPFAWLGVGHLLVLLASPDSSGEEPWMFGDRHGLPFLVVAAAFGAVAAVRARPAWLRGVVVLAGVVAVVDHGGKAHRLWTERPARTAAEPVAAAMEAMRQQPLPDDAVVLCYHADILAYELGVAAVHIRGFKPERREFLAQLRQRRVTHVLLTWLEKGRSLDVFHQWMTDVEARLEPHSTVVTDLRSSGPPAWRALLLRFEPKGR